MSTVDAAGGVIKTEAKAEVEADARCANCGMPEVDDVKLDECTDCDLVKYCGDNCCENHRDQHEEECKNRKAKLHDRKLFTQPDETHLGECPICFLPLPLHRSKSFFRTCCSETICIGCFYANVKANKHDQVEALRCPFCREPANDKENDKRVKKRIKANDPAALRQMGEKCLHGGDDDGAYKYYTKAAEFDDIEAHFQLGCIYGEGEVVEADREKSVYHFEKAAIGGHHIARYNLAVIEGENGNFERSAKHHIIAAKLGYEDSMKLLWTHFKLGNITKEDLNATLRTNKAAIDATKSAQRDAADLAFPS